MEQRIDIAVQDQVARSIRQEILGIGTAARQTHGSVQAMRSELAGLAGAGAGLSKASSGIRSQIAEFNAATAAARNELAAIQAVTNALQAQAVAARALASARGAGNGAAPPPPSAPNAAPVRRFTGGGGGGNMGAATRDVQALGSAAQLSSHHMANLIFQINDVVVSLASGQKPMMVAIQQGSQIGQIAQMSGLSWKQMGMSILQAMRIVKSTTAVTEAAALADASRAVAGVAAADAMAASNIAGAQTAIRLAEAEIALATSAAGAAAGQLALAEANAALSVANGEAAISARALATAQGGAAAASAAATGATVVGFTTLGIVAAAAAAVVVGALGGIALMQSSINDTVSKGELTKGLGLTAKEMRHLKDVTVTFGDTAKAVFQVTGRAIWAEIGPSVTKVWGYITEFFSWLGGIVKSGVNLLIGGFVGAFNAIQATWRKFPAAIGDLFIQGVNAAIEAINMLISAAVQAVNDFTQAANAFLPEFAQIGQIDVGQIATVKNQWAGAAADVGATAKAAFADAMGTDYVGQAFDAIRDQAVQNAKDRLRKQAEDKGYLDPSASHAAKKHGKTEAEKRAEALAAVNRELDSQIVLLGFYGQALERESQFQAINNALLDKHIILNDKEEAALRSKIKLIQDGQRVQGFLNDIEEAALGPQRDYQANLSAINIAQADGIISTSEANRQRTLANITYLDAIDPMAAYNREIERGNEALVQYGRQLEITRRAQEIFDKEVSMGLHGRDDKRAMGSARDQAAQELSTSDMTSRFADIDPREQKRQESTSNFILDNTKAMYAEIARLREENLISEDEANERKKNLDVAYAEAKLTTLSSMFGQLATLQNSKNREAQALGKAAAVAEATINGYLAVTAALKGPPGPPWSFAIAGATAAMAAVNVAKIAGVGFMAGGFTGMGGNAEAAGTVHRNEYVFDASATRRIGVPALEAMRRGTLNPGPSNDNGRGPSVVIKPMPGVFIEERRTSEGEIELIAARVARQVAPHAVAEDINKSPNSVSSKAMQNAFGSQRRR